MSEKKDIKTKDDNSNTNRFGTILVDETLNDSCNRIGVRIELNTIKDTDKKEK